MKEAMNQMAEKMESTFIDLDKGVGALSLHAQEAALGQASPGSSKMSDGIEEMKKILENYKFGVKPRD
jgi:hypothetical protein